MNDFSFADAGIIIGLTGLAFGVAGLILKARMDRLEQVIREKEAAMNAADEPGAPAAR